MAVFINPAWRRCLERFEQVRLFIDTSASLGGQSNIPTMRSDTYGAWVLITYAACQHALDEIGQGCMQFLGNRYKYARRMPEAVFKLHERMALDGARRLADGNAQDKAKVRQTLQRVYSANWAASSPLLNLDRNVWPRNVREWLTRIGISEGEMSWMNKPASVGSSDTYSSRLKELVAERNPIAHGELPARTRSANDMKAWLEDCQGFMENCAMTVELHLSKVHQHRIILLGDVNRAMNLSNNTVPFLKIDHQIRVGDHVLIGTPAERKKIARIDTIMCAGQKFDRLDAGHEKLAIGLSKPHGGASVYLAP